MFQACENGNKLGATFADVLDACDFVRDHARRHDGKIISADFIDGGADFAIAYGQALILYRVDPVRA